MFADVGDDVLGVGAGEKNFGDACLLEGGNIGFGNDAADEDHDVVHIFFVEEVHELRAEGVVRAAEDREADDVDIFLGSGAGDHLGGLAQAGVDDLHAGVAEGAGDDFGAAVVAIEAGLGDENANFLVRHSLRSSASLRQMWLCQADNAIQTFERRLAAQAREN